VPAQRHTQWPRNQTSHEHAACCVGVTLHRMRVKGIRWLRLAVGRAVASARRMDVLWKCPAASDPGAAARAQAEPVERPAAPQPSTATRRSPQPPSRPPPERRRAGRDPPISIQYSVSSSVLPSSFSKKIVLFSQDI